MTAPTARDIVDALDVGTDIIHQEEDRWTWFLYGIEDDGPRGRYATCFVEVDDRRFAVSVDLVKENMADVEDE